MNSKDLLSINEAFAKASSKVATDEPAKKDEVVTEGTEIVSEIAPAIAGAAARLAPVAGRVAKSVGKAVATGVGQAAGGLAQKAGAALQKTGDELNAGVDVPEAQVGDQVKVAAPGAPEEVGEILEIMPDATLKVATSANPDGVVVDIKYVTPLSDDEPGPEDGLDDGWESVMSDYENSLTSSKYKVREEGESGKDFKKPDESVSEVDKKTQRPKGEVKADEKSKDVGETKDQLQDPVEEEEKDSKKSDKTTKESINTCNKGNIMSEDKSIFDKLYESVMGEDDDFELGIPGDDDPAAGDEFGDEGGEEVTVTLTPDQAAALKAVVDQLPSDDEELGDDVPEDDPLADTSELEDSVQEDTAQTSDGKKPGVDPSDGGGKTTDPAADSLGGKTSGDGAVPVTDKEGTEQTGDGKKPGDPKHGKPGKQVV